MMMEEGYTTSVSGSAIIRSLQGHDLKRRYPDIQVEELADAA
jgi:hypothetical protein